MATETARNKGSKLSRTETVTVRLDPKLRYLADLAARKQRRTLSSYIEWAIEESLEHVALIEHTGGAITIANEANALYDIDEPDRLVKLAFRYPELLVHEEQVLWKLIKENGALWSGYYNQRDEWVWEHKESSFKFAELRKHWNDFKKVAYENESKDILPKWNPPPR